MLTPEGYTPRLIDNRINEYLEIFAAVCIEGSKWCGKTWTAMNHAASVYLVGSPDSSFDRLSVLQAQPQLALEGESPHLIDEWQEVPALWDAVRMKADTVQQKGLFILTGSATPRKKGILHSGAGRIGRLKMSTMTLYETGDSDGLVSLQELFSGNEFEARMTKTVKLDDLIHYCVRGGWPGSQKLSPKKAAVLPKQYLAAVVENDIHRLDEKNRDKTKVWALLHSLGRNESTPVSASTLKNDIALGGESVSEDTITEYLAALERLFITDNLPAFAPSLRSSRRNLKAEKRYFADPSLAVAALGASADKLCNDLKTFGFVFESLCVHDLRIYAQNMEAQVFHYRDYSDNEIDLVMELPDGRWGAFEIKLGGQQIEVAAAHLLKMRKIFEREGEPPDVLVVIAGLVGAAYQRPDGVYVIPVTSLKE